MNCLYYFVTTDQQYRLTVTFILLFDSRELASKEGGLLRDTIMNQYF